MTLAPIAFFAYKRPEHTQRALEALSRCELARESRLYIFCDGPKRPEDADAVDKVREIAGSSPWCDRVEVIPSERNKGLAKSIISGVSGLCEEFGRVIVLEDDLIVSPYFLRYMNDALELYKDEKRVMQVSGHMFGVDLDVDTDAIFLPFVTSWGWGTWKRAWRHFNQALDGVDKLRTDRKLRHRFELEGNYPYFKILQQQMDQKIDSWAIVWNYSVFKKDGLVLYPARSLVFNSGFDGSGTHCRNIGQQSFSFSEVGEKFKYPDHIETSPAKSAVYRAIREENSISLATRLKGLMRKVFK